MAVNRYHRVIIHLVGGDHAYAYFEHRENAIKFIGRWVEWQEIRFKEGRTNELESFLLRSGPESEVNCALMAQYVIGMHLVQDDPTPMERSLVAQERAAKAVEQLAKDQGSGEQWKGDASW